MPSSTEKQRKFMGAELARKRSGEKTKTDMSEQQLSEFASKPLAKSINQFVEKHLTSGSPLWGAIPEKKKPSKELSSNSPLNGAIEYKKPIKKQSTDLPQNQGVFKGDTGKKIGSKVGSYLGDKAEDALMRTKVAQKVKAFVKKGYTKYPKWGENRKVTAGQLDKWAENMKVSDARPIEVGKNGKIVKKISNLCKSIENKVIHGAPKYSEAAQGSPSKIPAYASDATRKRTLNEHKKYLAEKRGGSK